MSDESETANEIIDEGSRVPLAPSQLVSDKKGQLAPTPPVEITNPTPEPSPEVSQNPQPSDQAPAADEE